MIRKEDFYYHLHRDMVTSINEWKDKNHVPDSDVITITTTPNTLTVWYKSDPQK